MYNREAINILLWKAEMPCLNVWGVSQASQLCDRCHMSPELCTTTIRPDLADQSKAFISSHQHSARDAMPKTVTEGRTRARRGWAAVPNPQKCTFLK